jgi:Protein of unknown function (DUF1592)/Protein of unknown function (DUF1588)/Protein of unknown function (DUF1587)/Protein of unknown function (DUF1585)/Protein of unknown function (DUF1595)/Planctomycete cytochrome C
MTTMRLSSALFMLCAAAGTSLAAVESTAFKSMIQNYCLDCHDDSMSKGDLDLSRVLDQDIVANKQVWEDVLRRIHARQMPPADKKKRPNEAEYVSTIEHLEHILDQHALQNPHPGRGNTIRRMNRTEYRNAVRDLLAVDVDVTDFIPAEQLSHGFDNVNVSTFSPTLLDRYLTLAKKIAQLAVGAAEKSPGGQTFRMAPDVTQEEQADGLPFGTRGGMLINYNFPRNGEYEFRVRLMRDRDEKVEGMRGQYELLVLIDGKQMTSFTVKGDNDHANIDSHLHVRLPLTAGPKAVGVTFLKGMSSVEASLRQPYISRFNLHRHPRKAPAVYQVTITGPYNSTETGDSPSRQKIFSPQQKNTGEETASAEKIIARLLRQAYRRPVSTADAKPIMAFYHQGRKDGNFESGIEMAISAILVSREFLTHVEREPSDKPSGAVFPLTDIDLASRLSFFLWSSSPDDTLLLLAERGDLHKPEVLAEQVKRMLADPKSDALVRNFASQWLHLRNLDSFTPEARLFPDFDDNLRQSMRRETELLFQDVLNNNRSVMSLIESKYTYLNERLARHYGIPHVHGAHFRRVEVTKESRRGGILRHGSVLTVTSYATRTSPVLRGRWVLENILGTPPPPPDPNVPSLDSVKVSANLPVRERLAVHRENPACASCHDIMDPPGFAMEQFDAIGQWREREGEIPINASGGLPDGQQFVGIDGLEQGVMQRPELFAHAISEKLLIYALGRGLEVSDGAALRTIVRKAAADDYRLATIIQGVVASVPFTMKEKR